MQRFWLTIQETPNERPINGLFFAWTYANWHEKVNLIDMIGECNGKVWEMMKKVFLAVGHGGSDPGAVAPGLVEADLNLVSAQACAKVLCEHGVNVQLSRTKDVDNPLSEELRQCRAFAPDVAVAIHFNAGGGDGFEFWYSHFQNQTQGLDFKLGQAIEAEVKKLGQNSRGGKTRLDPKTGRDYFGFIRELAMPSIIVEGGFLDTNDCVLFDEVHEQQAFGVAYAHGILTTLGLKVPATPPQPGGKSTYYRVIAGSYTQYANAKRQVDVLQAQGIACFIEAKID